MRLRNRGYGGEHRRVRRAWQAEIDAGRRVVCCRCERPIRRGDAWDLDHTDDRTSYRGPACTTCNRSAGATLGNLRRAAKKAGATTKVTRLRW